MSVNWTERIAAFSLSPSHFLSGTTADVFLAELLRELRDDRASYTVKVLLLSPLCERPTLLCVSESTGEETALELMSVFAQCPPKSVHFRCHLLLALTSVLVCTSCVSVRSRASQDFLDLLLHVVQDASDLHGEGPLRCLRSTACDCLRELEACSPGLLSQRLGLFEELRQQETSRLHQAYAGLQTLVLRNAVYQLTQEPGAGAEHLQALLGRNTSVGWEAEQSSGLKSSSGFASMSSLILGPVGTVPTLQTGPECKELRSVLSALLEESYLLSPLCQAALLHLLTEVVAMVPGVPSAMFTAQLMRLLGTSEVCLLHSTLLLKSAFTDSLFSAEDEAFLLRRLVVLSQHPLLSAAEKLLYIHCILHFPENRPLGEGDEAPPLLLTPRLAAALMPTVFNDSATMLARLHLQCLVYLEEGGEEEEEEEEEEREEGEGKGLTYLYQHLTSLLLLVESGGSRDVVVTFFRAAFLFLCYFPQAQRCVRPLTARLCSLYLRHTHLAPHLLNLADRAQARPGGFGWAAGLLGALQGAVTGAPPARLTLHDLRWHLKVLQRVAQEAELPQQPTVGFLSAVLAPPSPWLSGGGAWRLGHAVLAVCRRLLLHPSLERSLLPLADVLQLLSRRCADTDVQDRARLYYTLLTTLSRDKLAGVLAQGEGGAGRTVRTQTLSGILAEGEGLASGLTIHQTDGAVVRLVEEQEAEAQVVGPDQEEAGGGPGGPAEALEAYRAQFEDPDFSSEITLTYRLTHTGTGDSRFSRLYSIRLHFSLTDEHYEELADVSVPCLLPERPPPRVSLRLRPRRAHPTTLHASAIFTTQDGLSWLSLLPDVQVTFQQAFLPLPAPPAWEGGARARLFQGLWEEIWSEEAGVGATDCATSLFCCQLTEEALSSVVKKHFLPYLISHQSEEEEEEQEEVRVLFFLPPRSHVLLKVRSEEDAVHFNIATDKWQLLPHLSSYLRTITSS